MGKRKQYDERFKESAVRLSYEYGNIMRAARELDIPYTLLYAWRSEYPVVRLTWSNKKEPAFPAENGPEVTPAEPDNA